LAFPDKYLQPGCFTCPHLQVHVIQASLSPSITAGGKGMGHICSEIRPHALRCVYWGNCTCASAKLLNTYDLGVSLLHHGVLEVPGVTNYHL